MNIQDIEVRSLADLEIRVVEREDSNGVMREAMEGLAIPFNKASEDLGFFIEIIPDSDQYEHGQG